MVTDSYSYSGFGEVDNYTAQVSAVDQFVTGFTRDKLGRTTQKTETVQGIGHTFDYTYNDAGYLVEVKRDGIVQNTYTYDLNGNRQNNGAMYDDQDRLTSTATASYTYADNGELLTKTEGPQITQYKYDVLGNLLSVTLPSGTLIEYVIDGRNRRIGRKVDGTLEKAWLYKDVLNPIAELDGIGNVTARYVYASGANVPDYVIKGGMTYRVISDHLGSPRLVINTADGTVVQAIEYDEWGNVLSDTNPGFTPFGFAGGLYDADTKLTRFGFRDYDPETGRWTSKDPIRFAGGDTNLFGYVLQDPINLIDPSGLINRVKFGVGLANSALTVKLFIQGVGLLLAAGAVEITGGPVPATPLIIAAIFKLNSARTAAFRASTQIGESLDEDACKESFKNLLGLLPFGEKFDDIDEPSPFDADLFSDKSIFDILGEIGTLFP